MCERFYLFLTEKSFEIVAFCCKWKLKSGFHGVKKRADHQLLFVIYKQSPSKWIFIFHFCLTNVFDIFTICLFFRSLCHCPPNDSMKNYGNGIGTKRTHPKKESFNGNRTAWLPKKQESFSMHANGQSKSNNEKLDLIKNNCFVVFVVRFSIYKVFLFSLSSVLRNVIWEAFH